MRTVLYNSDYKTVHSPEDAEKIRALAEKLGNEPIEVEQDQWIALIAQFCVMGRAAAWEKLTNNPNQFEDFKKAVSLKKLKEQDDAYNYLRDVFELYRPTRFYNKRAKDIAEIINLPEVANGNELVLFRDLPPKSDYNEIRNMVIKRTKGKLKMKSVSDLMISLGLSKDVIALDTRVVKFLKKHLDYRLEGLEKVKTSRIQTNKKLYLSIENDLREICDHCRIELGTLDRVIFRYSSTNVIDYLLNQKAVRSKNKT